MSLSQTHRGIGDSFVHAELQFDTVTMVHLHSSEPDTTINNTSNVDHEIHLASATQVR